MARPRKVVQAESAEQSETAFTAIKKKRSWVPNPQENFGAENTEKGDNSRFLRQALVAWDLPPIDISDEKQVEKRIMEYFSWCVENDKKPQKVEMAMWLGVNMDTVYSWQKEQCRGETHSAVIKKADAIFHSLWMDYMQNGKMNPASAIFLGKNLFGYRDVVDIAAAPAAPLGAETEQKALESKIADVVLEVETDG